MPKRIFLRRGKQKVRPFTNRNEAIKFYRRVRRMGYSPMKFRYKKIYFITEGYRKRK